MIRWLKRLFRRTIRRTMTQVINVCPECGSTQIADIIIDGYPARECLICNHWGMLRVTV